jgi:sec-independent protein translocase protein TatC
MAQAVETMPFLQHLEELRWRILKALGAVIVFTIPCWIWWEKIFEAVMLYPLRFTDPRPQLIITAPIEGFMLSVKIALAGGVICAVPVIFYQLWKFVSPGLYKHERGIVLPAVIASTISFLLGVGFCYLVLPYLLQFLSNYAGNRLSALFKIDEYLSFLIKLSLAFGLVFEMPVISFVLSRVGLLTPQFMLKKFRYAIVIIFIVAAILTPPDVLSQTMLAVPLLVLYAISILVSHLVVRRRQ